MPLPEGLRQYTKGRPIKDEEFEAVKKWFQNEQKTNTPENIHRGNKISKL